MGCESIDAYLLLLVLSKWKEDMMLHVFKREMRGSNDILIGGEERREVLMRRS